jgi:hypothetical protein
MEIRLLQMNIRRIRDTIKMRLRLISVAKRGPVSLEQGIPPPPSANTDVGFRGLIYVGGNLAINGPADVNGAVWVVGNVTKASGIERTIVFYDDTLVLPTLNVVLTRQSWDEVIPSSTTWL